MTITPSRLNDVSDAATLLALVQSNFTILAGKIAMRVATYQNGSLRRRPSAGRRQGQGC